MNTESGSGPTNNSTEAPTEGHISEGLEQLKERLADQNITKLPPKHTTKQEKLAIEERDRIRARINLEGGVVRPDERRELDEVNQQHLEAVHERHTQQRQSPPDSEES